MTLRRVARRTLIMALMLALICGQALATSIPCYINSNTKVYNAPSTSAASLNVPAGLGVTMSAFTDRWALVWYQGNGAFIPLNRLILANPMFGYASQNVPLYSGASYSARKLGTIPMGTELYVVGRDGDFFAVMNTARTVGGFIPLSCATPNKPAMPAPAPSNPLMSTTTHYSSKMSNAQKLEYVIYVAQKLYGSPYSSDSDEPRSFDCSRFVRYCFEQIGVKLNRSAQDQGYDSRYAAIMDVYSLRRGDVVCFNTDDNDSDLSDHTGIYLGYGYFVHASSAAGKVVVSSMVSGYYRDRFTCARRILG